MSKGSKDQTVRNEPPAWLSPHLQQGAQYSRNMLQQGGPEQYSGNTVVPFSPQTNQALNMMQERALTGSPIMGAANNLAQQTLDGQFLGGNPQLDGQINRAIQLTRTGLDSQFAGSGRNLEAQMPARADQVNNLTSSMLMQNYDQERGRQMQMMGMAPGLAREDYFDASQLANVGGAVEAQTGNIIGDRVGRWDFEQMRPEAALDAYLGRLGQNPGMNFGQQTSPLHRNGLSGAIGGGVAGAGLANALGGVFQNAAGTALGPWGWGLAGLGALGGLLK
jgi:hypothetical protein